MIRTLAIAAAFTLFASPAFAQPSNANTPAPHAMGSMKPDHAMKGGAMSHSMKSTQMKGNSMSHNMKGSKMASPAPKAT